MFINCCCVTVYSSFFTSLFLICSIVSFPVPFQLETVPRTTYLLVRDPPVPPRIVRVLSRVLLVSRALPLLTVQTDTLCCPGRYNSSHESIVLLGHFLKSRTSLSQSSSQVFCVTSRTLSTLLLLSPGSSFSKEF